MLEKPEQVGPKTCWPPAAKDRYVVRCVDQKYGPSKSSGNPMITLEWEMVGKPNAEGGVDTVVRRGEQEYEINGLYCGRKYLTLTAKAAGRYFEFQKMARLSEDPVDEKNPDIKQYENLLMQAIVGTETVIQRKELTEEDKQAGKTSGEPILNDKGEQITSTIGNIIQFLGKFEGEAPPF